MVAVDVKVNRYQGKRGRRVNNMIVIEGVKMPANCHECDSLGISDLVGLNCPHEFDDRYEGYSYAKKPKDCPLYEIGDLALLLHRRDCDVPVQQGGRKADV